MNLRILAAALVLATLSPGYSQKADQKVDALKSDLNSVKNRRESLKTKLDATKREVRVVRGDVRAMDQQLGTLEDQLSETTSRLSDSRLEQSRLARELIAAGERLKEKRQQMQTRLRNMYVRGDASVISAFVGVESVGDLASRKYILERIANKDRGLFDEVVALREGISKRKRRTDELVVSIDSLAKKQQSQQAFVQEVRDQKNTQLRGLRGQQAQLERLVAQLNAEERSIEAQIASYQAGPGSQSLPAFTGRLSKPVSAPITSKFGMRFHPILKINRLHGGIDFGARSGTPIRAAGSGIVIKAEYSSSFGNMVVIDHGGGISTLYAHCSSIGVIRGQKIARGQVLGAVGSTGLSTGPHLHFEVRVRGKTVNPMSYF